MDGLGFAQSGDECNGWSLDMVRTRLGVGGWMLLQGNVGGRQETRKYTEAAAHWDT